MEDLRILVIITVIVLSSYIDSLYTYPKMLKSGKQMQEVCENNPKDCWIQEKKHD